MPKKKKKNKRHHNNIRPKKKNIFVRIFRFFFPKNWQAELYKGRVVGAQMRSGKLTPKIIPTWWLGKGLRVFINAIKINKQNN